MFDLHASDTCCMQHVCARQVCCLSLLCWHLQKYFFCSVFRTVIRALFEQLIIDLSIFIFLVLISVSFSVFVIVPLALHPFPLPTHLTTLAAFIGILFTFHLCNFFDGVRFGGSGGNRTKTVSIMSVKSMNRNCFRHNLLIISQKRRKMEKQKINRRNLQTGSKIPCAQTWKNNTNTPGIPKEKVREN